jgi:3-deoxy-manno-octulosonate cytidylyltransferase (CMP-KDO synthetase)
MSAETTCIIPTRMADRRFPGRSLAPIAELPMLEHVYRRAERCRRVQEVVVATPDPLIVSVAERFGAKTVQVGPEASTPLEIASHAALSLSGKRFLVVLDNEPLIYPEMMESPLESLEKSGREVALLTTSLESPEAGNDPGLIKVVANASSRVIYLSRAQVPWSGGEDSTALIRAAGIMALSPEQLTGFAALTPGPIEEAEELDLLRFLENGVRIYQVRTQYVARAVNTPQDLAEVSRLMLMDSLHREYGT